MSHVSQCCLNANSIVDNKCENESNAAQHFLSSMSLQTPTTITNDNNYQKELSQLRIEFSDVFPSQLPKGLPLIVA